MMMGDDCFYGETPALSDREIKDIARQLWESGLKTSVFMPFVIGVPSRCITHEA